MKDAIIDERFDISTYDELKKEDSEISKEISFIFLMRGALAPQLEIFEMKYKNSGIMVRQFEQILVSQDHGIQREARHEHLYNTIKKTSDYKNDLKIFHQANNEMIYKTRNQLFNILMR